MDLDTLESISKLRGLVISEENVLYRAPTSKPSPTSQIITNTPGSQIIVTVCSASDPKTQSCDRDTKGSQGVGRDTLTQEMSIQAEGTLSTKVLNGKH